MTKNRKIARDRVDRSDRARPRASSAQIRREIVSALKGAARDTIVDSFPDPGSDLVYEVVLGRDGEFFVRSRYLSDGQPTEADPIRRDSREHAIATARSLSQGTVMKLARSAVGR